MLAAVRGLARPGRDRPDAAGDAVDDAAGRGRRARDATTRPGRRLLRRGDPGGAGAGRVRAPYRGPLDPGQRVVGLVRPGGEPVLRAAGRAAVGRTSSCATRWTPGDRGRLVAGRRAIPAGGVLRLRAPRAGGLRRARRCHRRPHTGTARLGEYLLDWDDVRASPDPHAAALEFARSAFRHACAVCGWDPALAASVQGVPRRSPI